ncbi:arsenical-resistance protein [Dichomitus squalens LYAD-421 SS1]|uniref:Arsenical-resistance protein n=1 Tax=Dichomitus squalens (strain LYAD-421) TaxID=732165 RepID=R7SUG8_DICSQ|nr:arsenical-resistance protein [Dichomitus squalens LYAD-421 SS1]EJF59410.1 arsenical-resistance protein [Dichomitus squalens LYAD-421 SS1]
MNRKKDILMNTSPIENDQTASEVEAVNDGHVNVEDEFRAPAALLNKLSILDRLLTPAILVCMVVGVLIGNYLPGVQAAFSIAQFQSVSAPIAIGLIVMMWPILTKVRYEALPALLPTRHALTHILLSLTLNWFVAPFLMLALAWAAPPDLRTYRTGMIMVGLARCIAMVMVWNALARGDSEYCAVLVVFNSMLQIVLYAPFALLFVIILGGGGGVEKTLHVSYGDVAIPVLIYLGIPLAAGVVTRFTMLRLTSRRFFESTFLPYFSPLALLGLLYTIVVMFAYQGHHIVHNLGPVFRVIVPLVLYFVIMWFATFAFVWWCARPRPRSAMVRETSASMDEKEKKKRADWSYEMAVVQSFTAASNDFELAIAVTIAVYGVGSDQALAATIGPLVEVPVLLALTWVALFLRRRLTWHTGSDVETGTTLAKEVVKEGEEAKRGDENLTIESGIEETH